MIKFIFKKWSLFADIAIVVGGILLFTFWDPFGIFTKTKTRATANMVSAVRDIGQLITAEYYGEVISSWKEFKITEFPVDTISMYAKEGFINVKHALYGLSSQDEVLNKVRELDIYIDYRSTLYPKFIAFLADRYLNKPLQKIYDEKNETLKQDIEKDVLIKIYKEIKNDDKKIKKKNKKDEEAYNIELNNYLDAEPEFLDNFYNFNSFITKEVLDKRKNRKKNIVFIGRGWVKAGFDFGKLDKNNFLYDRASKTIHMYGIQPVILDYDINPWFIPERKVKGFELVDYSGDVSFEDAIDVKKQCKEKLLAQARDANIVKAAMENGEEALINFFSVILDEPELQVRFYPDPYNHHYAVIAADTLIDHNESQFIYKLYIDELKRIDLIKSGELKKSNYKQLTIFIEKLKKLPFINKNHTFNYYSMVASQILQDTFDISSDDINLLLYYRDTLKIDSTENVYKLITDITQMNSCWFESGNFSDEFNNTIDLLKEELLTAHQLKTDTIDNPDFKTDTNLNIVRFNNKEIIPLDTVTLYNGTVLIRYYFKESIVNYPVYLYDFKYYMVATGSAKVIYNNDLAILNKEEIKNISRVEKSEAGYAKKMKPIRKLTSFVDALNKRLNN